ncbi:MAG: glycosyltransferase family protein [Candidatus Nanopelagicales bacterium]|nr:glycosyltransferase family protein [Candidatus Nanopelagicales bacterium]
MSTLAIVQARMGSTRLPGKVLLPLAGAPMLQRQLERIQRASLIDTLVVATSTDPADDAIAALAAELGIDVVRGPLHDVLERFAIAIRAYGPDTVVRLTADCPLASPAVIDAAIARFAESGADYCSNTLHATYPDGLDVEVVRAEVLLEIAGVATDQPEREHVTLGVYRHPERYRLDELMGDRDLSDLRWTVDTPEDYAFVREIYDALHAQDPCFDLDDVLSLLERRPGLSRTQADGRRNAALDGLDKGAMDA